MKGLILAGGKATRLYPLTKTTNKHLLPIGKHPMIYHPLRALVDAGIREIMIVTDRDHAGDIIEVLGSGSEYGADLTYRVQDDAGGIAQAIALARTFTGRDNLAVLLGDNMFDFKIDVDVSDFNMLNSPNRCRLFIKEVENPQRFGVVEFSPKNARSQGRGTIINIEEKPKDPKSNMAVVGIYFYTPDVFDRITDLRPSDRGELEVTDLNLTYLVHGDLDYRQIDNDDFWSDAGTFDTYSKVNDYIWQCHDGSFFK